MTEQEFADLVTAHELDEQEVGAASVRYLSGGMTTALLDRYLEAVRTSWESRAKLFGAYRELTGGAK